MGVLERTGSLELLYPGMWWIMIRSGFPPSWCSLHGEDGPLPNMRVGTILQKCYSVGFLSTGIAVWVMAMIMIMRMMMTIPFLLLLRHLSAPTKTFKCVLQTGFYYDLRNCFARIAGRTQPQASTSVTPKKVLPLHYLPTPACCLRSKKLEDPPPRPLDPEAPNS